MRRVRVALAALLIAGTLGRVATAADDDPSLREWNQARGNSARTGVVAVEPIRSEPVEGWRLPIDGTLLGGPVTWGGVVFVVTGDARSRQLLALQASTGEVLGQRALGSGGAVDLAVWHSVVIVRDVALRGFPFAKGRFSSGWKSKVGVHSPPCIVDGTVYSTYGRVDVLDVDRYWANRGSRGIKADALAAFEFRSGREIACDPLPVDGVLTATRDPSDGSPRFACVAYGGTADDESNSLWFRGVADGVLARPTRPSARTSSERYPIDELTRTATCTLGPSASVTTVVRLGHSWLISARFALAGVSGAFPGVVVGDNGGVAMSSIVGPAAVHDNRAFGFASNGEMIGMGQDGRFSVLVETSGFPRGAMRGEPSIANDVIYFGNWAVEAASGRVLWCLPDLEPVTAAIPVGDGRLVVGVKSGSLVCLVDSVAGTRPSAVDPDAQAPVAGSDDESDAPPAPSDVDGVLLADGRVVAGRASRRPDGRVRIAGADGTSVDVDADDLVVAPGDADALLLGQDPELLSAWRAHLDAAAADLFARGAEDAARKRYLVAARGLLERARAFGLSNSRAERVEAAFAGRFEHPNSDLQAPRFLREFDESLKGVFQRYLAAATWCVDRGRPNAAAALLFEAERLRPGDEETAKRATALVPKGFPWASESDAGLRWARWASEIVPAGGEFVPEDDPTWKTPGRRPASMVGAVAFRTRNLFFMSRELDPAVVGGCLRHGEGAVRVLRRLLSVPEGTTPRDDARRLDVRLYSDKASYLASLGPGGEALAWTAGVYSPGERASRFFVDRSDDAGDALGRGLFDTLAHELTHHFVHLEFAKGRSSTPITAGFWVVEGLATFIGDQSVEMGRRGEALDDCTAPSIDTSTQVATLKRLIPMADFVDMTQIEFATLDRKPELDVKLRNTIGGRRLSETSVFYEQAGSLSFFLLRRRGDAGVAAYLRYLAAHYRSDLEAPSASLLGFASAAELERAYLTFLADPEAK